MGFARFSSILVTLAILAVALVGLARWRVVPTSGRLIVVNGAFSSVLAVVMYLMTRAGMLTRVPQEIALLVDTVLLTAAFALWHTRRWGRLLLGGLIGVFVVVWVGVLLVERWRNPISFISAPIGNFIKFFAAAIVIIDRVWATTDTWTDKLWFWCGIGVMLIFGTEVVLFPAWQTMLGVRDDLILKTFTFHLLMSVIGYVLVARALWRHGRPSRGDVHQPG